jgi:DNA polymerase
MARKTTPGNDGDLPTGEGIDACRQCELWKHATQGVAGEGPADARVLVVGEQPGHEEDLAGRPFVGPAGALLRELLDEAGLPAAQVFITNAVKHFYFELRGKRRIHKTPLQRHVAACHDWLEREIARLQPTIIVTLGTTALGAVLGRRISIAEARKSELRLPSGVRVVPTYHPSAVLRAPDETAREGLRALLRADLLRAARLVAR